MNQLIKSMLRIVLDPGGDDEQMILDWGDRTRPLVLPWAQNVQRADPVRKDWSVLFARGGAHREIMVIRRERYATHEELEAARLDATIDLPVRKTLPIHIRVVTLPFPASSPAIGVTAESDATHAHYIAAEASLIDAEAVTLPPSMWLETQYRLAIGKLEKQ